MSVGTPVRLYLLGFDARVDDERTHHHGGYPQGWSLTDAESRAHVYRLWHRTFREIAQVVRARVINLNPESGIDAFTKYAPAIGVHADGSRKIYDLDLRRGIAPWTAIRVTN